MAIILFSALEFSLFKAHTAQKDRGIETIALRDKAKEEKEKGLHNFQNTTLYNVRVETLSTWMAENDPRPARVVTEESDVLKRCYHGGSSGRDNERILHRVSGG